MKIFFTMFMIVLFSYSSGQSSTKQKKKCSFDECNVCSKMKLWDDEFINKSQYVIEKNRSFIRGMTKKRKLRVITVGHAAPHLKNSIQKKQSSRQSAIFEAERKIIQLVKDELFNSPHGSDIHGAAYFYRGRSYSSPEEHKFFSDTMKKIVSKGKVICDEYDGDSRSLIIYEVDLKPLDGPKYK